MEEVNDDLEALEKNELDMIQMFTLLEELPFLYSITGRPIKIVVIAKSRILIEFTANSYALIWKA